MTNKRENSSIFSIQPHRSPDHNGDKIESTRLSNLLVKKNIMIKRNQENHHESKKFNDAGGVSNDVMVHTGHANVHNESGSMRAEENGRERLKRHRIEVAGRVWIPEIWGQEELLEDLIDCSTFDATLINSKIMSARTALVKERRRANSTCTLRIENTW